MHSNDREVVEFIVMALARRRRAALVTVTRIQGSAPRLPGAMLAIRDDGVMVGSVSGGCVDADMCERFLNEPDAHKPELITYRGGSAEGQQALRLPCAGLLEVLYEPNPPLAPLRMLLRKLMHRQASTRIVDIETGQVDVRARILPEVTFDGRYLYCPHGPARRMLIIGAGETGRYLAQFAHGLGYEVMVCDPREEYVDAWDLDDVVLQRGMPDDVVRQHADDHTAVVALTHDPKLDDMALLEALASPAFYVGALGSNANNAKRRARLRSLGLSDAAVARLHGPVGLSIGSRTPGEIAISILAQLTAQLRGVDPTRRDIPLAAPSATTPIA